MICPKCKFSFFTRTYSTATETRQVTCTICLHRFTAPLRADARRDLKEMLTDCLFDDDVYKNGTTIERVQWMTNKELDALWFRAMEASIKAGEEFTRYRFADLVAAAEREACALVCEARFMGDLNREDLEARRCAQAIRERSE